jgi:hypothetical protein
MAIQSVGVANAIARHLEQMCVRVVGERIPLSGGKRGGIGRKWMNISDMISLGKFTAGYL